MAINNQVEPGLKLRAVREYLGGNGSLNKIAEKYGVCRSTLQKWLSNYELFGEAGLQHRIQNQHYPEALKRQAVEAYLSEQLNIKAVCRKHQLRSRSQLEGWIVLYNGQKGYGSPEGSQKGIRVTRTSYEKRYERRKTAVEYCIEYGKDYKVAAASFGCTYQQIYGWVQTYHAGGLERLCGTHKKSQKKLTEVIEENKQLKEQERNRNLPWNSNWPSAAGLSNAISKDWERQISAVREIYRNTRWLSSCIRNRDGQWDNSARQLVSVGLPIASGKQDTEPKAVQ